MAVVEMGRAGLCGVAVLRPLVGSVSRVTATVEAAKGCQRIFLRRRTS
jgi:hypothetical protein